MNHSVSPTDERNLTNAIEKAATLASIQNDRDRNKLLADTLLDAGVDSKFAKVASAAFNKRLTVLTFQHSDEDHKSDPFDLSDAETVGKYMGMPDTEQTKTASCVFEPYSIGMVSTMEKKASTKPVVIKPLYEAQTPSDIFMLHLESMMDKNATSWRHMHDEYETLEASIKKQKKALKQSLDKAAAFDFQTLCNVYGRVFQHVMQDEMPNTVFVKTASAVSPRNDLSRKTEKLIRDSMALTIYHKLITDYQDGIIEFNKTAAEFEQGLNKVAFKMMDFGGAPAAGVLLRGGSAVGLTALQAAEAVRRATNDSLGANFSQALALGQAGRDVSISPSSMLDADFLSKDRYRDRLLAWSDMAADPLLADYPSEQVFLATQKAMDIDPAMERPDKRELLRSIVNQMIVQNNRISPADLATYESTLRESAGTENSSVRDALLNTQALDSVDAPEFTPDITSIMGTLKPETTLISPKMTLADDLKEIEKAWDDSIAAAKADEKDKLAVKEREEAGKQHQVEVGLKLNATRMKNFREWAKNMKYFPDYTKPGNYKHEGNAKKKVKAWSTSEADLLKMFNSWQTLGA